MQIAEIIYLELKLYSGNGGCTKHNNTHLIIHNNWEIEFYFSFSRRLIILASHGCVLCKMSDLQQQRDIITMTTYGKGTNHVHTMTYNVISLKIMKSLLRIK